MFKPGGIRKITVKDFVTYSYVEMYPGPHLNMLIGPNGTGKSTIVAAIILGLGGNPKTIGRGTKVSEYVKHNCTDALITIELQGHKVSERVIITRCFNVNERSSWKLNHKDVPHKEIDKVIKQLNIQVDNLCQFLPQDRVQDFAKMNKQQLLQQTQLALCRHDLIEKQQKLIDDRDVHKDLLANLDKFNRKLQEYKDGNIRLEVKVHNLNKKRKYLQNIEHIDRKISWINYEELRDKYDELKIDRNKAAQVYNKYKEEKKPIQKAIENAKKSLATIENTINDSIRSVRTAENTVNNKIDHYENLKNLVNRINRDTIVRLEDEEKRDVEIDSIERRIDILAQSRNDVLKKCGSDEQIQKEVQSMHERLQKISEKINVLSERKAQLENLRQDKFYEVQRYENELAKLENVKQKRLEWLRHKDKDAYAAVEWLHSNKNLFQGEVYEPMLLELNVIDPKNAVFLENMIPMRDRLAFTCVLKEDMNKLIRLLRDQQKLSVNVVHSGSEGDLSAYRPSIPIEQLKAYGMYAYVYSLVTGPVPIMKYLCKTYRIHCTPVGNHVTNDRYEEVPKEIKVFFSDLFRFSTSYSKYTGAKSTKQNEIHPDGSFSVSVDPVQMEDTRGHLNEAKANYERLEEQLREISSQISTLNNKQNAIRNEIKEIKGLKQQIQTIETKIKMAANKIQQLKADRVTREEIERQAKIKTQDVVKKILVCQEEIKNLFKKYFDLSIDTDLHKTNLTTTRKQVVYLENELVESENLYREAEQTLNHIKELLAKACTDAKVALQKAKQLSNGFTPDDAGFAEFKQHFDQFSDSLEELSTEKDHIMSKIDCLNSADDGELQEYEKRLQLINQLNEDIANGNAQLDVVTNGMDKLQEQWLKPLGELVAKISSRFSRAFQRMGCDGEVEIYKDVNEKDFSQYGLSIKVKFREEEMLQELNNMVQSGGERAVSTAVYMLSLQELTPVPFRCVDEINQGMDPNNERRIFELLVDSTSEDDTSQYFVITPKLIPNLKFVPSMKIHIVHNGPFVVSQKQWNTSVAIQPEDEVAVY